MNANIVGQTIGAIGLWLLLPAGAFSQLVPEVATSSAPQAPPPNPPAEVAPVKNRPAETVLPLGGTLYSIGTPTDEEQLYLEYINRARANPPAEGVRLAGTTDPDILAAYSSYGVDTNLLKAQFSAIPAAPPLAMNAQLLAAARGHSQDMLVNDYQGHDGSDGSTFYQRITAQGYSYSTCAENVFAHSLFPFYGHAGFNVDWGAGPGGMQSPAGHRTNIHNRAYREVGVGVVNGSNTNVGPQLVTQDFATSQSATPLITGVAYYDLNGNGFYDTGEGIGGVTVQVPGSTYYAVTATSGGYAVPVTTNGNYAMSFSASNISSQTTAQVTNQCNVKVDLILPYTPPTISGPNPAAVTNDNLYSFTTVGAATNYLCLIMRSQPYTAMEGAENGSNYVTLAVSSGYSVLASDVKASGSYSFHLCHPAPPTPQYLTLNPVLLPRTNALLIFSKRLGWAASDQYARVQVSTNDGSSWVTLWSQAGSGGSGESGFSKITNSLSSCAGAITKVRLVYDFSSGSYYPQTSSGVGLYLDDIVITNADQMLTSVTNSVPSGNLFTIFPTNASDYAISVCAQIPGRTLPWGPVLRVASSNLPPITARFTGQVLATGGLFRATLNVTNYNGSLFTVLRSYDLQSGTWATDTLATVQSVASNTQFLLNASTATNRAFYKIRLN